MLPGEVKKQWNEVAVKTLVAALNPLLQRMNMSSFLKCSREMIGCDYSDKIDVYKCAVNNPVMSMTQTQSKCLQKNKNLELYAPKDICQVY